MRSATQSLAGAVTQILAGTATQSLVGTATQSLVGAVTRKLAGTTRAASARAKAATGAGASTRKAEEIQMAEARSRTSHLAGLPHHHLAVAAEVEAEAMVGDLALAQSLLATARATTARRKILRPPAGRQTPARPSSPAGLSSPSALMRTKKIV